MNSSTDQIRKVFNTRDDTEFPPEIGMLLRCGILIESPITKNLEFTSQYAYDYFTNDVVPVLEYERLIKKLR